MTDVLLVPVDFSTCSLPLIDEAARLAKPLGAEIVLLHVADKPPGLPQGSLVRPDGVVVKVETALTKDSDTHLAPLVARVRAAGVPVRALTRMGPVVDTIARTVDEVGARMVVMGTHGRSGVARMVLGSIAEAVVRRATVPVVLVRRQHRAACTQASCNWCTEAVRTGTEDQLRAEADG